MAICRPFGIYKRLVGKKKRVIFYVQFRDENGRRLPGRSSGQSSKSAAEVWAIEQLAKGIIPSKANLTFDRYAESWFIWGKCEYIQRKLDRGISMSRGYADTRRINLVKNILPYFQANKLTSIKSYMVESWVKDLQKSGLSSATINICLRILKVMMKEAMRKDYIDKDPTEYVGNLKETRMQRAILTLPEVRVLFEKNNIEQIWGGNHKHYTINLLAASTGMRLGECQGLQIQHVHPEYVTIQNVWERGYGLKDRPKWNSARVVPIPRITSGTLLEAIDQSPYKEPNTLVFWSQSPTLPIGATDVRKYLYRALREIGISDTKRKNMNLTFHSWRHFFNSYLRAKVPDAKLRRITGHRTEQMTEHYTHFDIDDFKDVLLLQDAMFMEADSGYS